MSGARHGPGWLALLVLAGMGPWLVAAPSRADALDLESERVGVGAVRLHVVQAGPAQGTPVVLLHDLGHFWAEWRRQIADLARRGARVTAVDLRGQNLSEGPSSPDLYHASLLAADVVALIRNLGYRRVFLVGHGAGGLVAWEVALQHPARLRGLVVLSAPHPAVATAGQAGWPSQVLLAAKPREAGAYAPLEELMRTTAADAALPVEERDLLRSSWGRPGSLDGIRAWSEALAQGRNDDAPALEPVEVPALLLWGREDRVYPVELAAASLARCASGRLHVLPGAGHWLAREAAGEVSAQILEFIGSAAGAPGSATTRATHPER
jgi:pimeloyl-ACP methyl ester carboxylesterase